MDWRPDRILHYVISYSQLKREIISKHFHLTWHSYLKNWQKFTINISWLRFFRGKLQSNRPNGSFAISNFNCKYKCYQNWQQLSFANSWFKRWRKRWLYGIPGLTAATNCRYFIGDFRLWFYTIQSKLAKSKSQS